MSITSEICNSQQNKTSWYFVSSYFHNLWMTNSKQTCSPSIQLKWFILAPFHSVACTAVKHILFCRSKLCVTAEKTVKTRIKESKMGGESSDSISSSFSLWILFSSSLSSSLALYTVRVRDLSHQTTVLLSSSACVDLVNPSTGISDCSSRRSLCNNTAYYSFMTTQCPKTCGRCTSTTPSQSHSYEEADEYLCLTFNNNIFQHVSI